MRIPLTRYGLATVLQGTALLAAAVGLALYLFPPLCTVPLLLWVGLVAFFRDPERRAESEPHELLSPADGRVQDVEQVEPPAFLEGPALRVGIFMSVFDVHVNRSPADGAVRWVSHHAGSFLDARRGEAAQRNEHNLLGLELSDGRKVLVNQVAGLIARRIVCRVAPGDRLAKGQRFGMVKFGSRVELYLPVADEYTVLVQPGDRVKAGLTVLARWDGPRDAAGQAAASAHANAPRC